MAKYNTEQKRLLLDFLTDNSGKSFTIEEIVQGLGSRGGAVPARSTVYRLMTSLVEEKRVHRSASNSGRQFVYRSVAAEECRHHLHLQCTECGKLLHLDEETSHGLLNSVMCARGFDVSEADTVLMGRCELCREGKK